MSQKYPGGFITKSPVAPTFSAASGIWTLDQQQQLQKAGTWPAPPVFIEDLFSTYLYTGTGANQTITNGIDLSTKGGMVWIKQRTIPSGTGRNFLYDSARGTGGGGGYAFLNSNTTGAQGTNSDTVSTFNIDGFSLDPDSGGWGPNQSGSNIASWTFRKQPRFFDIVTWTGDGIAGRTVAHNLGSTPGCIIVKAYTVSGYGWRVYHTSLGATKYLSLEATTSATTASTTWNDTNPTSTNFTVGTDVRVNESGVPYVAYLFANDAGGFPVSGGGSTNGITCGSYTGTGVAGLQVNLGYEPQWLLVRRTDTTADWYICDITRGMPIGDTDLILYPNLAVAEDPVGNIFAPTATGFTVTNGGFAPINASGGTYLYIAIRRGPMKPPTVGTDVFKVETYNQTSASDPAFNLGKVADMGFRRLNDFESNWTLQSRLTANFGLVTNTNDPQSTQNFGNWSNNIGWYQGGAITPPYSQANWYGWTFARAPGFFDVSCYTGTGSLGNTLTHNLGVTPELMIVKCRSNSPTDWTVYTATTGNTAALILNYSVSVFSGDINYWNNTSPTASQFTVGLYGTVNGSARTYIAYLFATLAGVSKVGSYTGTGALLTVNCGFTSGARFVLIKRSDSTGDWYVYDSVRGLTSGNDPYMVMNSTAVQVDGTNYVDTDTTGFKVTAAAPAALNASGGSYIFLAIA